MLVNTFGDELQDAGIAEEDFMGSAVSLLGILADRDNSWFDDVRTAHLEDRDDILRRSVQDTMDFWGRRAGDLIGNFAAGRL